MHTNWNKQNSRTAFTVYMCLRYLRDFLAKLTKKSKMGEILWKVWFGLVFAVITIVILGLEMSFTVYAVILKETFNLTQTQVELVSASGIAGMGASLAEPFVTGRFGYRAGYLVAMVTNTGAALLMWVCAVNRDVIKDWPGVICLIQFVFSFGQNVGSTLLTSISIQNVPGRYVGLMVGLAQAAIAGGKIFYGGLLQMFFPNSFGHFFLCVACICGASIGICAVFHTPQNINYDEESQILLKKSQSAQRLNQHPVAMMFRSAYFHLTFWPSVVVYTVGFSYMSNITSIALSLGFSQPMNTVFVLSSIIIIGRFFFGMVFDKFQSNRCGFILLLSGAITLLLGIVLLAFFPNAKILLFFTALTGISISLSLTIPSSLLAVHFGRHHFSYIIGCFYVATALFTLLFLLVVGIFYDETVSTDGFCYGPTCFFLSSLVFLAMVMVCASVHIANFVLISRKKIDMSP